MNLSTVKSEKFKDWRKKITNKRGRKWRENLSKGKMDVLMHPSNLRIARIEFAWRQEEVATKAKINLATYGAIERGIRRIREKEAKLISALLKKPFKTLFKPDGHKFLAIVRKT